MSTNKNNNIFEKTSFLGSNSSQFIEELYADYLNRPNSIPSEWKDFFEGLKDKKEEILKTVSSPSWSPKIKKKKKTKNGEKFSENISNFNLDQPESSNVLEAAQDSVRANMLIRAYRIRGHLISDLDPLGLLKHYEHPELKPETYGFSNKDINRKIYLDGVLGLQSATLKEIIKC
jgi:2-oxoglutarate dehydrogenase complex, dehydrogenase (E1) component, and related enzymes